MRRLWLLLLPGGALILLAWWLIDRHQRAQFEAKSYPEQIQALTPDRPMALPAVRPLKAQRGSQDHRLGRFQERLRG